MERIRELYHGDSREAHRFRYGLVAFDLATIAFIVVTSFLPRSLWIEVADVFLGLFIITDFAIRFWLEADRWRFVTRPSTWADIAAIFSFLAPITGEGLGFLRAMRTLRLLHSYQLLARLRRDSGYFRKHEDVFLATVNLFVFLFVVTGMIYVSQVHINPQINNYADALYFTVTTLTTTGFGDITLLGTTGRMLAVAVMIFGVTLFLRLAQVMFRPSKVRCECKRCGLALHDADAIHCKHCGAFIHIDTEGLT
ncbi:ion channel [Poseidonocella sp. HB161398]|uniref:ion channel n=1 Tax=Poseidonocella sp. HB161398 TaxID=2320855 RepID=UPI001486BB67|nr:ion channel [Poseidonocella sp. HB161398]